MTSRAHTIIGLIGGLGPESTVDYYEKLIAGFRARGSRCHKCLPLGETERGEMRIDNENESARGDSRNVLRSR